ncbi:MAG: PEP-CTERM sorting domain-containing protein [Chlorobia bacterium]|nr:PEP-CTERM sorting domain-containing protein [Fimbriimonadaceae bacterium]
MKRTIIFLATALACVANAQLYTNGYDATTYEGIWDSETGGFGGGRRSTVNTAAGESVYGYDAQTVLNNTMADDFTVTGTWSVTGFSFFLFQTDATAPTITTLTVGLKFGSDPNTASTVFAPTAFTAVHDSTFQTVFRAFDTNPTEGPRGEVKYKMAMGNNIFLIPGQYWLTWSAAGSASFPGPFQAPIVPHNARGNAMQQMGSASFLPLVNGTQNNDELPFAVEGALVPEPATVAALGLGFAAIVRRRRTRQSQRS